MKQEIYTIRIGKETREVNCSTEQELANETAELLRELISNNVVVNSFEELDDGACCTCEVIKGNQRALATLLMDVEYGNVLLFGGGYEIEDCPFTFNDNENNVE